MKQYFLEIDCEKFNKFLIEALTKHQSSELLMNELNNRAFHLMNSYKKDFVNSLLNTYYGIQYIGLSQQENKDPIKYKIGVVDKKLSTFFLITNLEP
jgi:hypothetical protein